MPFVAFVTFVVNLPPLFCELADEIAVGLPDRKSQLNGKCPQRDYPCGAHVELLL